ncbi:hypothetical protein AVEN_175043-1 [Araneus ventricosus]|uniref:Uncharacterized protein n=1 Tax=Araneus ventricosus TaxID=182803 RepID=A0A4Y2SK96_ARAVE|nr:hypothetical protein AVEN_191337-1 [Araneus ventricosus]GBN88040.1 hypothetical protein AVEN_175043-1 [Araneus ventricosus]
MGRKLINLKEESISFLKMVLNEEKNLLLRSDYRMCQNYLNTVRRNSPSREVCWQKPGAFHKARWMFTIHYSAKMYAFSKRLEYDNGKIQKLHQMRLLKALLFVKIWLNAQNSANLLVMQ